MSPRILIVEDDATARAALRDLLEFEGFVVDTAARGDAALNRQREAPPDLLIADLCLPDQDGLVVAHAAQAATGCAVLLMTGRDHPGDKSLGYELVMKPIDFETLLSQVRRALATHPS